MSVEHWPLDRLRPHPENATIFGDPEESPQYAEILKSIRQSGIWEPICVKPDGTILAGHLRATCARELKLKTVPVRVFQVFGSYLDEVRFVIRTNTDRRQLSPQEIALAFTRLKEIPREQGGAKPKRGRPVLPPSTKSQADRTHKSATSSRLSEVEAAIGAKDAPSSPAGSRSRDDAAEQLGVPRNIAEACAKVFTTPGVPEELKTAVNKGKVAPTTAAKAVRTEEKRQGGKIKTPTALVALATEKPRGRSDSGESHESRIRRGAEEYQSDFKRLVEVYRDLDRILTKRPLKSLVGPTEHHEYGGLIRDIAIRAWREVEQVSGQTNVGKQMTLTVIQGGGK